MIEIQVDRLVKSFEVGHNVLDGLTFQIDQGERVGLLGRNGAGKTTLFKILTGELDYDEGQVTVGQGRRVGLISQIPVYPAGYTVEDVLRSAFARLHALAEEMESLTARMAAGESDERILKRYGALSEKFEVFGGYDTDVAVNKIARGLSISDEMRRQLFDSLSGGEKTRVNLGRLILEDTDILLLDEPTNHLDIQAVRWLEDFLADFEGTVLVVSHDRHFLNNVCTHIVDIDYGKIKLYVGNYEFWYESSQLVQRMIKDQNRKNEEKIKELQNFIQRFAANKSKSRQATSRRKLIDKLSVEEMPASSRRYPWVAFDADREAGKDILEVRGISKTIDGEKVLDNVSFIVRRGDKIAFISDNELAMTTLFQILMGEMKPDEGSFKWGVTTSQSYFPKDNNEFFEGHEENMLDWIAPYSRTDTLESTLRGFLGRMLFSGDDVYKPVRVLSGGEKVRLMLARMMLFGSNVLVIDQPTNHLDLESITAVNNGVRDFKGTVLFASHDHEFVQTIATRIIEIREKGVLDKECTYDEFLEFRETYKG